MPPDTFKGQSKPVSTVGFPTVLITNKELPEPIAYTVTKTVVENKDALVRGHGGLAEFDPRTRVAAREGRHPPASGRRAGVPREGVDEIAADLVLDNGRILTLDPRRPVAAALAVARGRVVGDGRARRRPPLARPPHRASSTCGAPPSSPDSWTPTPTSIARASSSSIRRWPAAARSPTSRRLIRRASRPQKPDGQWIVTMPVGAPPVLPGRARRPGRAALADARRPRRRRARASRLHARHLGLLEPPAGLLRRQQPRAGAGRHHPRHGAARAASRS